MEVCSKCGAGGIQNPLYDAISDEGIVKVCRKCLMADNLPIVKRPTEINIRETERKQTVYERLAKVAGVDKREEKKVNDELVKQEESLRSIVEKNFSERVNYESKDYNDLIDNFHWIIMRARRRKHLTAKQLGDSIGEPELAIKMSEQKKLPEEYYRFVTKLENFLGINLFKDEYISKINQKLNEEGFNINTDDFVTIEDLKNMTKKKEGFEIETSDNIFSGITIEGDSVEEP